jgi:hypothetical protein
MMFGAQFIERECRSVAVNQALLVQQIHSSLVRIEYDHWTSENFQEHHWAWQNTLIWQWMNVS